MKKLVAVIAVLALLLGPIGCETLCRPTVSQVIDASNELVQAEGLLAYLVSLVPSVEVQAAIAAVKLSIATLKQVKDGKCVDPVIEAQAKEAINLQMKFASQKLGYRR